MSIANLNTQGQRLSNHPYQLKNLQALKKIYDSLNPPVIPENAITTAIVRSVVGAANEEGTVIASRSVSFANTGTVNIEVDGVSIRPGEKIAFDAGLNNVLNDISYLADATGAEVLIITTGGSITNP
tara:strand:- start:1077 stop:1457 length:381 start_codon:yes stop_codon:yes gene_type:complete